MTALVVEQVSKTFDGFRALNNVSMKVESGERRAIIGPNGAGKSTLFSLLGGQAIPTSGRVILGGKDVTGHPVHRRWAEGIARTFQRSELFPSISVGDNMALAVTRRLGFGHKIIPSTRDASTTSEAVSTQLAQINLSHRSEHLVSDLAYGEQRQLELGLALAGNPSVLLLDEPTAGMSVAETKSMIDVIKRLPRAVTILIVEHDMDVVYSVADRILVLHLGEVIADGPAVDVRDDEEVARIYLGGMEEVD